MYWQPCGKRRSFVRLLIQITSIINEDLLQMAFTGLRMHHYFQPASACLMTYSERSRMVSSDSRAANVHDPFGAQPSPNPGIFPCVYTRIEIVKVESSTHTDLAKLQQILALLVEKTSEHSMNNISHNTVLALHEILGLSKARISIALWNSRNGTWYESRGQDCQVNQHQGISERYP